MEHNECFYSMKFAIAQSTRPRGAQFE